ncbi:hypothetical protein [Spirosoma agri]|uniref:DUF4349 domain-containing protein n=1 Tax=Spirosoma agri TaxID=1987381 RepID=A0A6M0ILM7_9BACT|nr:hypothetical protein [Spirosoma agri]NEU69220.1 hypothetical protein [Spirosoma agri]
MKNTAVLFVAALCLFFSSCHRPVAYFQPTSHPAAARIALEKRVDEAASSRPDLVLLSEQLVAIMPESAVPAVASTRSQLVQSTASHVERRMQHIQSLLAKATEAVDQQPKPKPKPKGQLRLGNKIRQGLGIPLREELNWWQRISWKLKASVIILLVAILFAILHVTILAIIFGIVGAFLMISGLKRSFKVRRPWF